MALKRLEIDQDNLCMKFSAFNVDFSSPITDTLGSVRQAQASLNEGYPIRSGFLQLLACLA